MTPEEYVKLSIEYRGILLHEIVGMEVGLNLYLMEYFCANRDKEIDFQNLILGDDRMNLGAKVQIVQYLITNYDKDWGLKYISIINNDRKKDRIPLNVDLAKMIEHRNIFAHRMLAETDIIFPDNPKEKNTVRFIKFKDEVSPLDYDEEKFANIIKCIQNIANYFYDHKF